MTGIPEYHETSSHHDVDHYNDKVDCYNDKKNDKKAERPDDKKPEKPEMPELPDVADIVLAQDLSGSFSDDLPNLQGDFVTGLDGALAAAGATDVTYGISSFIDYPFAPFGASTDFIYNTDAPLSDDPSVAQGALDGLMIGSGGDPDEAQLVALQQVALRADDFGFRDDAEGFVVLSTDFPFHQAGDYPAGGPNDNDTDLADGLGPNGEEDYPSIDQVAEALGGAGLTPIFTVTADQISTYEGLLGSLNAVDSSIGGAVVELSADSSDLADAIIAGLGEATMGIDIA